MYFILFLTNHFILYVYFYLFSIKNNYKRRYLREYKNPHFKNTKREFPLSNEPTPLVILGSFTTKVLLFGTTPTKILYLHAH